MGFRHSQDTHAWILTSGSSYMAKVNSSHILSYARGWDKQKWEGTRDNRSEVHNLCAIVEPGIEPDTL